MRRLLLHSATLAGRPKPLLTMLMFYVLGMCLATNTTLLAKLDQPSCSKLHAHGYDAHQPETSSEGQTLPTVNKSGQTNDDDQKLYDQLLEQEEEKIRLEYIKQKILKKLGMTKAPQPDPQFSYQQLLDIQQLEFQDGPQSDTISSNRDKNTSPPGFFSTTGHTIDSTDENVSDRVFIFPIKSKRNVFNLTTNEASSLQGLLRRAYLNLKLQPNSESNSNEITLNVLVNGDFSRQQESRLLGRLRPMDRSTTSGMTKTDQTDSSRPSISWQKYDFTSLLDSSANFELHSGRLLTREDHLLQVDTHKSEISSAFITLEYDNAEALNRAKRSVDCSSNGNTSTCCREQFYVNFTSIGWHNWILQPTGYYANYCKGKCDVSHARYHHTTVLTKYSQLISLCCSPREMSPISLIYVDEANYVFQKNLPNMVVESCDCA